MTTTNGSKIGDNKSITCGSCFFWHRLDKQPHEDKGVIVGSCRRNPPQMINQLAIAMQQVNQVRDLTNLGSIQAKQQPQLANQSIGAFPTMASDDVGCGEHPKLKQSTSTVRVVPEFIETGSET